MGNGPMDDGSSPGHTWMKQGENRSAGVRIRTFWFVAQADTECHLAADRGDEETLHSNLVSPSWACSILQLPLLTDEEVEIKTHDGEFQSWGSQLNLYGPTGVRFG